MHGLADASPDIRATLRSRSHPPKWEKVKITGFLGCRRLHYNARSELSFCLAY
jgi:hypothetical protein